MNARIFKLFSQCLVALCLLTLIGCSNDNQKTNEATEKTIDSTFINDLEKALQKRWDYIDDVDNGEIEASNEFEHLETLLSFEKDLHRYADEDFNDPKLKAIAINYIDGLKSQEEAIQYYNADYIKYDALWSEGYDMRSTALLSLVEEYALEVDEEQFKQLKINAQLVKEQNEIIKKIDMMVNNIQFNKVKTEYGWTTYSATVENTSGVSLEGFNININLLDENDIIVDTQTVYHSHVWKPNQKVLFEFTTEKTNFKKMEWDAEYYITE